MCSSIPNPLRIGFQLQAMINVITLKTKLITEITNAVYSDFNPFTFYLACHHQYRAAIPGRRPRGPFRLNDCKSTALHSGKDCW